MKKLLIPSLFLAACAVEQGDVKDQQVGTTEEEETAGEEETTPGDENQAATLYAGFYYEPRDCSDNSVYVTPIFTYSDGSSTDSVTCQYELEDGTVFAGCPASLPVPTLQNVVLTAYDPVTGATARFEQQVQGPETLQAVLNVSTDDLTISWDAASIYGASGSGSINLAFDPADKVIIDDPAVLQAPQGTVRVTEPGTYTVTLTTSISFGQGFGCTSQAQQTIEVCHEEHNHAH